MPFVGIFEDQSEGPSSSLKPKATFPILPSTSKKASKPKKDDRRGCEHCEANGKKGIKKILGKVTGKKILVFAQSPGPEENDLAMEDPAPVITEPGFELVGRAGKWWWKELRRVGITRDDVDVQNSTRCYPADLIEGTYRNDLKMRNPSKEEVRCCSLHTENMIAHLQAKHIVVLGKMAAQALLRTRSVPTTKVFWSDDLKAKIYLLDHPAFFLRGYGKGQKYQQFRDTLDVLASDLQKSGKTLADRYAFLKKQDYRLVVTEKQALQAEKAIRAHCGKKRVSFDVEDADFNGERKIICIGFSPKSGLSYVFMTHHRDVSTQEATKIRAVACRILSDPDIHKVAQFGSSDVTKIKKLWDCVVEGYDHDTLLSEYLRFSDVKKYGLDNTVIRRYPEFSGYWTIINEELLAGVELSKKVANGSPEDKYKFIEKNHLMDMAKLSLETLRLYNGADADVTKRIEVSNKKEVNQPLMQLYIDLGFLLQKMEKAGPKYDYKQHEKVLWVAQQKEEIFRGELRGLLEEKLATCKPSVREKIEAKFTVATYNPGSPDQVRWALYEVLELEYPGEGKPNTTKKTLLLLSKENPFPKKQLEWRSAAKVCSILESYEKSANAHDGRLRTRWNATGTRTGRFSSGGSRDKNVPIVNLQNVKKEAQLKNCLIADENWRVFYQAAKIIVARYPAVLKYWKECDKEDKLAKKEKRKAEYGSPPTAFIELCTAELEKWVAENLPELKTFLNFDYGQIEVRVMAQMSGDKNLQKDCAESDIHTRVGVTMTGWDADAIANDEQTRTLTKNVHFGIMFGLAEQALYDFVIAMSPPEQAGKITREEVSQAYRNYFKRYPGVKRFQGTSREFGREHKYVETLFGMKQALNVTEDREEEDTDFFDEEDENARSSYWGNQAVNGPVQGTAHQLVNCGSVNLVRKPKTYKTLGIPPMEVHDALYFVVKVLELLKAYKLAKYLLEKDSVATAENDFGIKFNVPIVVDAKAGLRLGCQIKVNEKTTVGGFLLSWFRECKKQILALNAELLQYQTE